MNLRPLLVLLLLVATSALAAPRGKKQPPAPKDPPAAPATTPVAPVVPAKPAAPRIGLTSPTGGPGVPTEWTTTLEQGLERELRRLQGPSVVTSAELESLLGAERSKQLLGGESGSAAMLADLTDLTDVMTVNVTARGSEVEVTARRTPANGSAVKTAARVARAKTAELIAVARQLVADLFPEFPVAPDSAPAASAPSPKKVLRVAVLDPRVTGDVPARARAALEQALTPELRKVEGIAAINSQEIRDLLGAERQKQLLGCSEEAASCMEELAGAVGADELVTLDLTLVGRTYALTARRLDTVKAKVLQTHLSQFEQRDGEELLAIVGPTVAALYPERALRAGAARGVEAEVIRRLNPPPLPRWVFFTTAGLALAAGAAGGGFYALSQERYGEHQRLAQLSLTTPVPATQIASVEDDSKAHFQRATVCFAIAGGLALAALVEAFFTDWQGDRAALAAAPVLLPGGVGFAFSRSY